MRARVHTTIWMIAIPILVLPLLAACAGSAAEAESVIIVRDPWARSERADQNSAAYMEIANEGDTGCPDVCPLTLSFMAHATEELGEQADDVTFLLITVDPERDDTERLDQYIARTDEPLIALTGERAELEAVWADYDIAVERHDREDGDSLVDHSAQIWLLSPDGELSMFVPMGSDGNDLANDIRWLLNRSA